MARMTYRTALRAKGVRKLPPFDRMRTSHRVNDGREHHIICSQRRSA